MRINSIPPKELISQYIHVQEKSPDVTASTAVDKAEITSEAKTFSAALKAAKNAIDVQGSEKLGRIEQISKQVEDNTYSVSGRKVAEKMLGE